MIDVEGVILLNQFLLFVDRSGHAQKIAIFCTDA
jgi:hypothetical protein